MTISPETERMVTLREALSNSDSAIRFNAGLDLVKLGDVTGIPALIEAFEHESSSVRLFHGSQALVQLGKPAVPALEVALLSDNPQVQIDAACTLYQIEPDRFSALLPILNAALQSDNPKVMGDALQFLSRVTEQDRQQTVPALLQALRNTTPAEDPEGWATDQRVPVAILLAKIGGAVGGHNTSAGNCFAGGNCRRTLGRSLCFGRIGQRSSGRNSGFGANGAQ